MGQERGSYLVMLAPPVPAAAAAAACPPAAASRRRHLLLLLLPVGSGAANLIQAPQQQRQQQEPPAEPRRCCLALVRVSHSPAPGSERVSTRVRKSSIQKSQVRACLLLPAPPLLRAALLRSALLLFFSFLRRRRLLLLLLPGALSVPELLLRFPSSSSSSLSLTLSLFLPLSPSPSSFPLRSFFPLPPFLSFFFFLAHSFATNKSEVFKPPASLPTKSAVQTKAKKEGTGWAEWEGRGTGKITRNRSRESKHEQPSFRSSSPLGERRGTPWGRWGRRSPFPTFRVLMEAMDQQCKSDGKRRM
ncbi:uncharacterized protein LOC135406895 isoform X2 [Pseudopipra pipra]|uniref:uncharacterized protein LOC135406895 isoform X2 n=1 Tax=Pseudopipra pipra TaxID=415032 RepID=UPI003138A233